MSALETQIGGDHYQHFEIQPVEFIVKNNLNWMQGNVIKYTVRAPYKGGAQDIDKAIHYLQMYREYIDGKI